MESGNAILIVSSRISKLFMAPQKCCDLINVVIWPVVWSVFSLPKRFDLCVSFHFSFEGNVLSLVFNVQVWLFAMDFERFNGIANSHEILNRFTWHCLTRSTWPRPPAPFALHWKSLRNLRPWPKKLSLTIALTGLMDSKVLRAWWMDWKLLESK